MAHPAVLVKESIRYFLHVWNLGLKPSLSFITLKNGAISVKSNIVSFPPTSQAYCVDEYNNTKNYWHSGRNSRLRRKKKRAEAQNPQDIAIAEKPPGSNLHVDDAIPTENYSPSKLMLDENEIKMELATHRNSK